MGQEILTTVIRHPKERLKKCSLRPLEGRKEITFLKATKGFFFDATGYIVLALDSPILSPDDRQHPLLLLDSTWRLLPELNACLTGEPIYRSLPKVQTAYPRVSKIAEDPLEGLASVEALYLARRLLGDDDPSLLDGYYWKNAFLSSLEEAGI